MEENIHHLWHVTLNYFKKGKDATEMQNKFFTVYGDGSVTD